MKKCSGCLETKDESHFSKNGSKLHVYCKPCASMKYKEWRNSNIEEIRFKDRVLHYKRKYNLSHEEAHKLASDRVGSCQICGEIKPLVVDHCHSSGEVRGLVCSACNSVLGYAKDNPKTLASAIDYLKDFYEDLL